VTELKHAPAGPITKIGPQPGPQEKFLAGKANIILYGGAAGGGKTYGLLLDPIRYVHNPQFGAVIFRRTSVQLKNEGSIWDTSETLYPLLGAKGFRHSLEWRFPSGAKIKMSHMEHDKNRFDWKGAQIPWIGWEEVTEFSEKQFWYLFSRTRSTSGVPGQMRGTCNPDPDSFIARLVEWWIDPKTGYGIAARSGVIRWFIRLGDEIKWGDTREELIAQHGADFEPKSLTFIMSNVYDNKILLQNDPNYLATLKSLPLVDREQLLKGNWLIRPAAGLVFKRSYFEIVDAAPAEVSGRVRYWDRAATPITPSTPDPDATVGVKMSRDRAGIFYIEHVEKMFASAYQVDKAMLNMAEQDGKACQVAYMQDPGSAGKGEAEATARMLAGYIFHYAVATGDKVVRAKPASSQAEKGNIKIVRGKWNEEFLRVIENFPEGKHDDEVDGLSGAFERLTAGRSILLA
jgi:predicted phage terminase large subunit-like protein